jgi:hypothetical protein
MDFSREEKRRECLWIYDNPCDLARMIRQDKGAGLLLKIYENFIDLMSFTAKVNLGYRLLHISVGSDI